MNTQQKNEVERIVEEFDKELPTLWSEYAGECLLEEDIEITKEMLNGNE